MTASLSRSTMTCRRRGRTPERNAGFRHLYLRRLNEFETDQLIFIDESRCTNQIGRRKYGWAPHGVTPVVSEPFQPEQKYQILPAYTQDGILLSRVYPGATTVPRFEDFIRQLLCHCGRWPEPKSVLVMDDAPWHNEEKMEQLCAAAGVKLLIIPQSVSDINPLKGCFAEIRAFARKHRMEHKDFAGKDFKSYLEMCVNIVGSKTKSARNHFKHVGLSVEDDSKLDYDSE